MSSPNILGHNAGPVIVMVFQYGSRFSGPGKDTFHNDRAVGEAENAHLSNFLHPVFYYYETLPTGKYLYCKYSEISKIYSYNRIHPH